MDDAGGQAGQIQLYINSAEFTVPNFTTGADANTLYKNGLRTIIATITAAGQAPTASNNLSSVNFNNNDGWTIQWALPSNRANDLAGNTWYGGPGATGTGSFTVVPVMYTPSRTINSVTINPATSGACGGNINLYARPFRGSYGAQTRDTLTGAFNCAGVATDLNGHAPSVIGSIDRAPRTAAAVCAPPMALIRSSSSWARSVIVQSSSGWGAKQKAPRRGPEGFCVFRCRKIRPSAPRGPCRPRP